ncbi:hypothetical protein [Cellulomonas pakistanensis]|uniref:Uncharacterized protein n=1 Tax=Cellulomonas pakistanensis TaxID=992287 RepID=A0A919U3Q5_9CELL|nr:hypothetical protein [Cellulomonas pakistanensis]GIG37508.1 hypothetical protein Cpa01nite_28890 [Cellulomonas pakistanensis]
MRDTDISTRRLRINLVAAPVLAIGGGYLGVVAAQEGRTVGVAVAALQVTLGVYLLVWSLRQLRRRRRRDGR